ncbi:MAG: hypothetical protein M1167_04280 [Chloroflexi bacterium]|nr:hypothetical protein [Chloroflexota bacterium]
MIKKKSAYCLTVISLVALMLSSTMLTVTAQTDNQTSGIGSWQPPKNFVDPVTLKIREFRTQGLSDDQITVELEKLGMGWYPKTGATWLGRTLTTEEQAKTPINIPAPATSNTTAQQGNIATSLTQKTAVMRTSSYSWTGVSAEIVTGSMDVSSGQTQNHYLCVQLGDLSGITNWAEAVVTHNVGETYKWYTYDSDESGGSMVYYMDKNTPSTATDTYVMMLDGTQDSSGWKYDVWINYNWVRSGHLANLFVQGGFQNEVFSNGQYNNDASHSTFYRNWLHNAGGWSYWTNSVSTTWSTASPVHESHYMSTYSYYWDTWVQN